MAFGFFSFFFSEKEKKKRKEKKKAKAVGSVSRKQRNTLAAKCFETAGRDWLQVRSFIAERKAKVSMMTE